MKKLSTELIQLVTILNDGQYHDGTSLGYTLGMTRSAIWKMIKKLESYDIQIASLKGKGYALIEPLILLNQKLISKQINQKSNLMILESVGSTNDILRENKNTNINICLAEQQTAGRGRFQRDWYSPFAQNIYLSCAYAFNKDISELGGLSLVVGLAVLKTLELYHLPHSLFMKWPNDILYQNRKIAGNLIEIEAESHGLCRAIIGIGINVNLIPRKTIPINQSWTSLRHEAGHYIDRNQLAISLIDNLLQYLAQFEKDGLLPFVDEWNAVDGLLNQTVTVKNANQKISGQAKGIDTKGHLILELLDGKRQSFSSGDTSIAK